MAWWKKKLTFDERYRAGDAAAQEVMMQHILPWYAFTEFVDLRDGGVDVLNDDIEGAWRNCIEHYGAEIAEDMKSKWIAAMTVAPPANALERGALSSHITPPIETCSTCDLRAD
jgi:hypothetical protein